MSKAVAGLIMHWIMGIMNWHWMRTNTNEALNKRGKGFREAYQDFERVCVGNLFGNIDYDCNERAREHFTKEQIDCLYSGEVKPLYIDKTPIGWEKGEAWDKLVLNCSDKGLYDCYRDKAACVLTVGS